MFSSSHLEISSLINSSKSPSISFGIYKVFDSKPEGYKQVQGKPEAKSNEGQINKAGPYHTGTNTKPFRYAPTDLKASFLKIIKNIVK